MRCPKCGFISFDQISECLKCGKTIAETSSSFYGNVRNVSPPLFLRFDNVRSEEDRADMFAAEEDYVDEDLEILVDSEDDEDELELSLSEEDEELTLDETEEGDLNIDMAQFEADAEGDEDALPDEEDDDSPELSFDDDLDQPALEVPEELADISDLEPPVPSSQKDVEGQSEMVAEPPAVDEPPLDDLDFDLDIDVEEDVAREAATAADTTLKEETVLSLDDLDFSDALGTPEKSKKKGKKDGLDMDEELNFDLDLGGLSIHEDI